MMKNKTKFWDRVDLYLRVDEENIHFENWQSALMIEFSLHRAAMTRGGALEFVLAGGKAHVNPDEVSSFIDHWYTKGLLKYHYELRKTGKRMRIYKSTLQPDRFEYQLINVEAE